MTRIAQEAQQILRQYNLFSVPVDVYAVAERLDIAVEEREFEDEVSGVLVINGGKVSVGLNQKHPPNRKRFTLAHELGHYRLHSDQQHVFVDARAGFYRNAKSSEGTNRLEIEANEFAASLLMPETMIRSYLAQHSPDLQDSRDCARFASRFGVSEQALILRLTNLGLLDNFASP